jgi:peptidoglycan/LPS O-acetylase OafA/YrhL
MKPEPARYPMFDYLRLFLALSVVLGHVMLSRHENWAWLGWLLPIPPVPAFLAISGFVILGSMERSTIGRFWWRRSLRILPALLASFVMVWILAGGAAVHRSFINYLTGGVVVPPGGVNGPLWSLGWEELTYAALSVLWPLGAYRHRWFLWVAVSITSFGLVVFPGIHEALRAVPALAFEFVLGNLAYAYRIHLFKLTPWWALPAFILVAISIHLEFLSEDVRGSFAIALSCPLVLLLGMNVKLKSIPDDYSYGCYIYHWPLLTHGLIWLLPLVLWVSRRWIEKPALSLKNWSPKRRKAPPSPVARAAPDEVVA